MTTAVRIIYIGISRMFAQLPDQGENSSRVAAVPLATSPYLWLPASMLLILLHCHAP